MKLPYGRSAMPASMMLLRLLSHTSSALPCCCAASACVLQETSRRKALERRVLELEARLQVLRRVAVGVVWRVWL